MSRSMVRSRTHCLFLVAAVLTATLAIVDCTSGAQRSLLSLRIDATRSAASFLPDEAFGAGLDGLEEKDLARVYSPENIKTMAGAPYRRLAYRVRTELGVEVWHWNEAGSWSNAVNREGYWTSSDKAAEPLLASFGYRLPRRGSTIDQAENDGYSRLDDGDVSTFWKSNPYLDTHFTGLDNALHPQWLLIDLGERQNVNALRILWGEPYATRYEAQYWDGEDSDYSNSLEAGVWRTFEGGLVQDGKGGDSLVRLSDDQISVRFVRVLLFASSGTAPQKENDLRDRLGFAVRELFLGALDGQGSLQDVIEHGASNANQTLMTVSSTDPWHREIDRDPKSAQPGFDRIMASGLGRGNPVLIPVPVLYNTPENAAAEIRFLQSRGFPLGRIELGEEPDGQGVSPEHYGALYLQFAGVVHGIDPALITGGPGFQSEVNGWNTLADASGQRSWMKRFLAYLGERRRLDDFGFFSFEWYPFDDLCEAPAGQLMKQPGLMKKVFATLDEDGVPRNIPWIISEYGYSSFAGRAEVELPAALLNAEIVAQFLMLGGKTAYYYGLEPNRPIRELGRCAHRDRLWGNLMMFQAGPDGKAKWRLPAFYGGKMLVEEWAQPINAQHRLYPVSVTEGETVPEDVTAYAVFRPDGRWAVLLLNKGRDRVSLGGFGFDTPGTTGIDWSGPFEVIQYSPRQYIWRAAGSKGHPVRSRPPRRFRAGTGAAAITLPPLSLTVVRGAGPHLSQAL